MSRFTDQNGGNPAVPALEPVFAARQLAGLSPQ